MYVHSVVCEKCVEPKALVKECCWLPYLEMRKLCIQDLGHVLYAAVMLLKFYKITSLEKNFFFFCIRDLSKQYGFVSQDFLVVRGNGWGFLWSGRHTCRL